jgi:oligoribonuclease NrnB/cAMP/cGMP phosphodiesterase (DHH superfamily)
MRRHIRVEIVDHHVTAQRDLEGLVEIDTSECAAVQAWRRFVGPDIPLLFQYVQARDLWQQDVTLSDVDDVAYAWLSMPIDFKTVEKFLAMSIEDIKARGRVLREFMLLVAESAVAKPTFLEWDGYPVVAVNTSVFGSDICHRLLDTYPEAAIAATWVDVENTRFWRVRSRRGEPDVAKLCEKRGGGGHPSAAGFRERLVKE